MTGNFPVQDAPPMRVLVSGLFGPSGWSDAGAFAGPFPLLLGSLSFFEFEKTMKLSSTVGSEGAEEFFLGTPPPRFFGAMFSRMDELRGPKRDLGIHGDGSRRKRKLSLCSRSR